MPLFNFGMGGGGMDFGGGADYAPEVPQPNFQSGLAGFLGGGPGGVDMGASSPMSASGGGIDWSKLDFKKIADALGKMTQTPQPAMRPPQPLPLATASNGQGAGMDPQLMAMLMKLLAARGMGSAGGSDPMGGGY